MRRFGLFCFNVFLAVGGATLYAWLVRRDGWSDDAWLKALQEGGAAGFLSGVTVGLGATLGPRPALSTKKCIVGQIVIAATSLLGGAIAYLFPQVRNAVDEALAERGILWGSGVGMVIGTVFQFFEIYFKRRKASR